MDVQTFGARQADAYEEDLLHRCEQIANGTERHQSCSPLVTDNDTDLRFTHSGQHFIVFIENEDEAINIEFLHSRRSLPAKLSHMARDPAAWSAVKSTDEIAVEAIQ